MSKFLISFCIMIFLFPLQAMAGPEGNYNVEGTDPGTGNVYSGTVTVKRNGQTYAVLWNVGGTEYLGTGLGAADVKGVPTMGPASENDTAIAISYVTEGSFGLTFYVEQPNGQWQGIWTYAGSDRIGSEVWTPTD